MVGFNGNKKKLTVNLSFFAPNDHNKNSSAAKSFEPNGTVGLGIVAAMNELDQNLDPYFSAKPSRTAILAVSPRSTPIPILGSNVAAAKYGGAAAKFGGPSSEEEDSEEYTCVIQHIGNNVIKKREYFDDVLAKESKSTASNWVSSAVVSASSTRAESHGGSTVAVKKQAVETEEFLKSCDLCKKQLQGLDIFMYRGEKAFCSAECRFKQISMDDELKEKCGSEAMLGYSVSPCASSMQFPAGVAAA